MSLYVATIASTKARIITDGFAFKKGKLSHTDCRNVFELKGGCVVVHIGGWKSHAYCEELAALDISGSPAVPLFELYAMRLDDYGQRHAEDRSYDGAFLLIGPREGVLNNFYCAYCEDAPGGSSWFNWHHIITGGVDLYADGVFSEREEVCERLQLLKTYELALPEMEKLFYEIRSRYSTIGGTTFVYDLTLADGKVSIEKQIIPSDEPVNYEVCSESGMIYNRVLATAVTSGQVDLSKAGVVNRVLSNIADDANFAKVNASALASGDVKAAHISGQSIGQIIGSQTFASASPASLSTGWQVIATASIDIPTGTNSITFEVNYSDTDNHVAGVVFGGIGFSIAVGSPASPQASIATKTGSITLNSPTTGTGLTLSLYVQGNSSGTLNATTISAKIFQDVVQTFRGGFLT